MQYSEFRQLAIDSAGLYYDFLSKEGKGVISTGVLSISALSAEGFIKLRLSARLSFISDLQVKIYNQIYTFDEIMVVHYDDKDRSILIRPREELVHLFFDLSPWNIVLISDLKFLVRRVQNWYRLQETPLSLPDAPPCIAPEIPNLDPQPSLEQEAAFHGIFSVPFSYIWGAPGTGKTQFVLARAVLAYCLENKRVLITAPTNNAVEQTLEGVLSVLKAAGVPLESVLRLGIPSKAFYDKYPEICEVQSVEDELEYIEEKILFYQKCLAYYDAYNWTVSVKTILERNIEQIQEADASISRLDIEIKQLQSELNAVQASHAPLLTRIDQLTANRTLLLSYLLRPRSKFTAMLCKKRLSRTKAALDAVDSSLQDLGLQNKQLYQECDLLRQKITAAQIAQDSSRVLRLTSFSLLKNIPKCPFQSDFNYHISRLSPDVPYERILANVKNSLDRAVETVNSRSDFYVAYTPDIAKAELTRLSQKKEKIGHLSVASRIQNCRVIAATLDCCISKLPANGPFHPDHVFLDEAAYCPLIKGAVLLSYGAPLTFLGDHMQLPPVCEALDSRFRHPDFMPVFLWAQSSLYLPDIFSKSAEHMVFDYLNEEPPQFDPLKKFDLLHTYRFGESLAYILSRFIYTHEFQGNQTVHTNIFVLHAPKNSADEKNTSTSERDSIRQLIAENCFSDYAILTPYRKQRALLAQVFSADLVFTIHGSQGREWDNVILSVVATSSHCFLTPRLINTAVSRAKKNLFIVCDAEYWQAHDEHLIGGLVSIADFLPQ